MLLGNRRPSLRDVRSRWRHFWLSSHEIKTISNLKHYNNGPFISPFVSNNVLAMFWRSVIDSKYNTYNVRCLATKIDGNSNFKRPDFVAMATVYSWEYSRYAFRCQNQLLNTMEVSYDMILSWWYCSKMSRNWWVGYILGWNIQKI